MMLNLNEATIASAMICAAAEPQYTEQLDRLYKINPASPILRNLSTARMAAIIKNDHTPDVIGEFLAHGGTYAEFDAILEATRDIILTPSALTGAINREVNRVKSGHIREVLAQYESGQSTIEDVAAAVIDEESDYQTAADLLAVMEADRVAPAAVKLQMHHRLTDKWLGGLTRKHMTILAARPAVGKSDYALSIARNVMAAGGSVFVASLEMDRFEILKRLKRGAGSEAALLAMPGHMRIDDRGDLSVPQIAAAVNAGRYDLVIVDHMQLLNYTHRTSGLYERMTMLSNQLRIAAKHGDSAWLVVSQLSRQARDEQKIPQLADLRDSGAIEQDAYAVIFLHEPEKRAMSADGTEEDRRHIHLTIAKNRGGACRYIPYLFTPRYSTWEEN